MLLISVHIETRGLCPKSNSKRSRCPTDELRDKVSVQKKPEAMGWSAEYTQCTAKNSQCEVENQDKSKSESISGYQARKCTAPHKVQSKASLSTTEPLLHTLQGFVRVHLSGTSTAVNGTDGGRERGFANTHFASLGVSRAQPGFLQRVEMSTNLQITCTETIYRSRRSFGSSIWSLVSVCVGENLWRAYPAKGLEL